MLRILPFLLLLAVPLCAQTYLDSHDFGGIGPDGAYGVAFDTQGNCYSCGKLDGTVDLEPGTGVHDATGYYAGYVVKYDSARDVVWSSVFNPVNPGDICIVEHVATDSSGNVYATGRFTGSCDFDPGAGQRIHDAVDGSGAPASYSAFLVKLDSSGNLLWDRAWVGSMTWAARLAVTDTRVCMTGLYGGTIDLDPGAGTESATTPGTSTMLVTLDETGSFQWAHGYSSSVLDMSLGVLIGSSGDVWIATSYVVDIKLGQDPGDPQLTTLGNADTLLIRYDSTGALQFTGEIAGVGANITSVALCEGPGGDIFMSGSWRGTVDFDPGAGAADEAALGTIDGYVAKYTSAGVFEWVRTFASYSDVESFSMVADSYGVMVGGTIFGQADLDPGTGTVYHDGSSGVVFAVRLNVFGNYVWSANWGGGTTTELFGMAGDGAGTLLSCGPYQGNIDLDPGPGTVTTNYGGDTDAWLVWLDDGVTNLPPPMQIEGTSLPLLTVDESTNVTFTATGGSGSGFQWSLVGGQLPPGITGIPGGGTPDIAVSGAPTAPGTYNFRLRVDDDNGSHHERSFTWTVASPGGQVDPDPPGGGGDGGGCTTGRSTAPLALLLLAGLALASRCRRRTD